MAIDVGQALAALPPAVWMRGVTWAYPVVETLHIVGLACLVGSIAVVDLRILGWSKALPAHELMRHVLPFSIAAFGLVVASGLMLFLAHAGDLIGNRVFLVKMGLIGAAGVNAALFHTGSWARPATWNDVAPLPARVIAAASLLIWAAVISCGRWIAYA